MKESGEIDATGETARGRVTFEVTGRDAGTNATGSGATLGTRIRFADLLA
jgi:hypothetical protein